MTQFNPLYFPKNLPNSQELFDQTFLLIDQEPFDQAFSIIDEYIFQKFKNLPNSLMNHLEYSLNDREYTLIHGRLIDKIIKKISKLFEKQSLNDSQIDILKKIFNIHKDRFRSVEYRNYPLESTETFKNNPLLLAMESDFYLSMFQSPMKRLRPSPIELLPSSSIEQLPYITTRELEFEAIGLINHYVTFGELPIIGNKKLHIAALKIANKWMMSDLVSALTQSIKINEKTVLPLYNVAINHNLSELRQRLNEDLKNRINLVNFFEIEEFRQSNPHPDLYEICENFVLSNLKIFLQSVDYSVPSSHLYANLYNIIKDYKETNNVTIEEKCESNFAQSLKVCLPFIIKNIKFFNKKFLFELTPILHDRLSSLFPDKIS